MAVFLFKMIFLAVCSLSNLISRLIFTATAYLLVLIIQAFKVPGQAAQGALEKVAEAIKGCFEYVVELVMELISSLISTAFDLLVQALTDSMSLTGSAIGGLVEKTRTSLDGLLKDLPELAGEFSEMISTMVTDLWNNYKDAVGYVTESTANA